MGRSRNRSGRFTWGQLLLIPIFAVLAYIGWQFYSQVNSPIIPSNTTIADNLVTPTMPEVLTDADFLPTLTPNPGEPLQQLIFPTANVAARIVNAALVGSAWETRYLGDSVGHLQHTSWLHDPGGNIVLIAHVEDAQGRPGPFAHLFDTKLGDIVLLRDGDTELPYHVVTIDQAAPDDLHYLIQDGHRRLTMITCSDWDQKSHTYLGRLVVVAVPQQS